MLKSFVTKFITTHRENAIISATGTVIPDFHFGPVKATILQ